MVKAVRSSPTTIGITGEAEAPESKPRPSISRFMYSVFSHSCFWRSGSRSMISSALRTAPQEAGGGAAEVRPSAALEAMCAAGGLDARECRQLALAIGSLLRKGYFSTVGAVKVEGERAYDLAREGEEIELAARELYVESLTLLARLDRDHVVLEMVCGKGGYVRSIARDLGEGLGCIDF